MLTCLLFSFLYSKQNIVGHNFQRHISNLISQLQITLKENGVEVQGKANVLQKSSEIMRNLLAGSFLQRLANTQHGLFLEIDADGILKFVAGALEGVDDSYLSLIVGHPYETFVHDEDRDAVLNFLTMARRYDFCHPPHSPICACKSSLLFVIQ